MPFELWLGRDILNSFESFTGKKHFRIQAVGKPITSQRNCPFTPSFFIDNSGTELPAD